MKVIDPYNVKHRVNRLIKEGKFNNIIVQDHSQMMITYNGLRQTNPKAFFELTDHYFIIYDGKQVTAYSIK